MTYPSSLSVHSIAGSLERYINEVNRLPILNHEEEVALARCLQQDNDIDAAKPLVLSHLRLVVSIARGYLGYGLPHADLIQEGNIGLMKAVRRFDPERGVRLVSFAIHWIRAEIHEFILRNWRIMKVATTKAQRKLFFNLRGLKKGLGPLAHDEVLAVAKRLGVKPKDVIEMESRLGGQDVSLELCDEDDAVSPLAYLGNSDDEPSRILESGQTLNLHLAGLQKGLNALDQRSRRVVEARWLNENEDPTLHDLATEFGISAERVRQIERSALQRLKLFIQK